MVTHTNLVRTTRSICEFDVTIPSGSPTSAPLPYSFGDYALGTVTLSGALGNTGHLSLKAADVWGIYRYLRSWSANWSDMVLQSPTAATMHDMPPSWFGVCGSAQLVISDGSGSAIAATAIATFAVSLKS
jgi:hypothetical protein